ncbi:MAG: exo-beta-N-acetylmuramidase NamZ domain-containing protein [Hydrogenophaga sp.]|uniref:exo-beta-N-acetylmuramidase NamZ family protein n=1 Tax=Hydrogenophaga sp. TaxID=1904254 RepID=UPI003D14F8AC
MQLGIERFLKDTTLRAPLAGRRVALLAHPASVTRDLTHALDALAALPDIKLSAAFGPQHGLRGDKQDNMVESPDFNDPRLGIPVFSLYGQVRRPTDAMMDSFDVLLVDLQDLGCRIYTFITTLRYVLEAAAKHGKAVWVLDRPNPAGRPVEGLTLREGWESFVGAGPMPMRHGMTIGELGHWFMASLRLQLEYRVISMDGWQPESAPGFGWPTERTWVNPSPNAANLSMARAYAGTVMLEGTTLSEGRGTTRPLELFGAPDMDARRLVADMRQLAPQWLQGCVLRECFFEPTFHKHAGKLCHGVQIHVEDLTHYDHAAFRPWRLQALAFRAMRLQSPDYPLWRDFPYEYEHDRLAIDLINGGPLLREWVDDMKAAPEELDAAALADEDTWARERLPYLLY